MKRFILLAAGAALLTACETASEIDAVASGGSGSSEATSASSSAASTSSDTSSSGSSSTTSSSSGSTSSSSSGSTSSASTAADSGSSYSYDTDLKTALIKVGDRVLFGYDSSELDDEDRSVLDKQAKFLNQNPSLKVTIEGHCDERGTR